MSELLSPDFSLIHRYNEQDNQIHPPVAVTHFQNANKNLYFINASHESDPNSPTFETVKAAIERYKPRAVVIESTNAQGFNAQDPMTEVKYTDALARQNNAQVIAGEALDSDVMMGMLGQGYSVKDVMGFYILRNVPQNRRQGLPLNDETFGTQMEHMLQRSFPDHKNDLITFPEFKQWYARHANNGKAWQDTEVNDVAPYHSPQATYFQQLSAASAIVREQALLRNIDSALRAHGDVLVVYGGAHLTECKPVLEQMFGTKGETVQLAGGQNNTPALAEEQNRNWQSKVQSEKREEQPEQKHRLGKAIQVAAVLVGAVAVGVAVDKMLNQGQLSRKVLDGIKGGPNR